jgi:hypothetical protein
VDTRRQVGAFAAEHLDALRLMRDAQSLRFDGFRSPGRFRYAPLHGLPQLLAAAALSRVADGDGDGALALVGDLVSLLDASASDGRFGATFRSQSLQQSALLTGLTLGLAPPSSRALAALDALLIPAAEVDALALSWETEQALFIDQVWRHLRSGRSLTGHGRVVSFLQRPWTQHQTNRRLAQFDALIAAARQPWRDRLHAIDATTGGVSPTDSRPGRSGLLSTLEWVLDFGFYRSVARHAAQQSTLASVLRAVVAIEQFRRAEQELPERLTELDDHWRFVDPLTDGLLRYRRNSDSYTVYGVGGDGLDNDGDLGTLSPFSGSWWIAPEDAPDWGVRVRLREDAPPL